MTYVEDPWTRIINVYLKKDDEPPPDPNLGPAYCGQYGYGAHMVRRLTGDIVSVPAGEAFPPMAGTFRTDHNLVGGIRAGGLEHPMQNPVDEITAYIWGLHAQTLTLWENHFNFSNYQLITLETAVHPNGWVAPMAEGQNLQGVPIVIKSYTFSASYQSTYGSEIVEHGIGITHPLAYIGGPPQPLKPPRWPALLLGNGQAGGGDLIYDFKYKEWVEGRIIVDEGNFDNPFLGGPAILWSMGRANTLSPWHSSQVMLADILIGEGDEYQWYIRGECQPMPPIGPGGGGGGDGGAWPPPEAAGGPRPPLTEGGPPG